MHDPDPPPVFPRDPDPPPVFPRRLGRGRLIALDAVAAAGSTLVLLVIALARPADLPVWAACPLAAAAGLPVSVRRLWPLPVFGVVFTASVTALLCGLGWGTLLVAAYALYMVALTEPRHPREPTLIIAGVSAFGVLAMTAAGPRDGAGFADLLIIGPPVLGGAWTIGRAVRERRAYAERSARQLADRAVTEERLRIARELHDVVSHTLSLIGVKAGVAGYVLQARPAGATDPGGEARDALRVIETTSREALVEMRHMLGMLRSEDASPDLRPAPDLAGLPELRDRAAAAGVRVDLTVDGAGGLPDGLGRSVYRIVQEAVTNVVRHAAPARCEVVVTGDADEVRIRVTDDGPGNRVLPGQPGHGIIGMRERALMHGGTLTAGPRPEGGFEVSARLPRRSPEDP
ncbi:sensor histidine kinase [Actinoallomurus soli]|uniref:sensor histidine kinase n=1 Tax=Actinoallomurus soli TaxID=2952535 RepID=UPI00209323D5|nr:sensor histidine kinase [Actinoallomurus soli]MCO5969616.1 sensor histidine kinase [Actinoallomurus soli]